MVATLRSFILESTSLYIRDTSTISRGGTPPYL